MVGRVEPSGAGRLPLGHTPSWRALAAKRGRELPVLSMTEHDVALICRLMPTGAAYGPTRVAVAPYAVHTGIRHNQDPLGADLHQEPQLPFHPVKVSAKKWRISLPDGCALHGLIGCAPERGKLVDSSPG